MRTKKSNMVTIDGKKLDEAIAESTFTKATIGSICGRGHGCCHNWIRQGRINKGNLEKVCKVLKKDADYFTVDDTSEQLEFDLEQKDDNKRLMMSATEASEMSGIPYSSILKACQKGEIKHRRMGMRYWIPTEDFMNYLGAKKQDNVNDKKDLPDSHSGDKGCDGCAFEDKEEWEMPCDKCKRNCKDYWRAKEHENED